MTNQTTRSAAFDDALQNAGHALMLPDPVPALIRVLAQFRDEHRAEVLALAADAIDAETRQAKADGVLEPEKYRPCRDASAQLRRMADETATETPEEQ